MRRLARAILAGAALLAAAPALADEYALDAAAGARLFTKPWVGAGSSTKAVDGLGPLYNARACGTCHHNALDLSGGQETIVLRLIGRAAGGDPVYGRQVQTFALPGIEAEARIEKRGAAFALADLGYGPLDAASILSPRRPPALRGIGLLSRVPDEALRQQAAAQSALGLKGRLGVDAASSRPGRFGWKAEQATLEGQIASAFALDLGLGTGLHPAPWGDCTAAQSACRAARHGAEPGSERTEIAAPLFGAILAFLETIPAPPQAAPHPGAQVFAAIGCATCHRPEWPSADAAGQAIAIAPYSDLLLHDMGDRLADSAAAEAPAMARLWRTAPLWGLGAALSAKHGLLHDGRAASLRDAILAHNGEAAAARSTFERLGAEDRRQLLAFLERL